MSESRLSDTSRVKTGYNFALKRWAVEFESTLKGAELGLACRFSNIRQVALTVPCLASGKVCNFQQVSGKFSHLALKR